MYKIANTKSLHLMDENGLQSYDSLRFNQNPSFTVLHLQSGV